MTEFYNRSMDKEKRRMLRNNAPGHERLLWDRLKGRQLDGLKFRRQYSVGPYIMEFYCPKVKFTVELDGAGHSMGDQPEYDANRTDYVERFGIDVLRFTNDDIERDIESVLKSISDRAKSLPAREGSVAG